MSEPFRHTLFRLTLRDDHLSQDELLTLLEESGMQIDRDYGVVPLNKEQSQLLVRGIANEQVLSIIGNRIAIEVFEDLTIGPMKK
jgi:hypothetical protein